MSDKQASTPSLLVRLLAIAGGSVVAIGGFTGGAAGVMAALDSDWARPDAFVVFFGGCSLVAALLGVLVAIGRFRATVGLTLLIGAGILLVGGALSEPQLVAKALGQPGGELRTYFGVTLRTLMLVQLGSAGLGAVLSALHVWMRQPGRSLPLVLRSAIAFALLGAIAYAGIVPSVRSMIVGQLPTVGVAVVTILAGVLGILFLSVGGHTLIRSFEVSAPDERT